MLMNATVENPILPCELEKADLDFDAIVREIVEQKDAVLRSLEEGDHSSFNNKTKPPLKRNVPKNFLIEV